jgi:HD-like signal output (HDOD) protein
MTGLPQTPPSIDQVCEKARQLPCAPSLLPRLSAVLQSDETSALEIGRLISLDASLAGATLRLANSAAFSRGTVDSLEDAIFRLGAREIFRLAALVLVNRWEAGQNLAPRWEPGDFSRHALITAIGAEALAEGSGKVNPRTAYTGGLINDLGKLALAHACAEYYPAILSYCERTGSTLEQAERAVLGYHHADVSARMLAAWNFPDAFVKLAAYQLNPQEAPEEVLPLLAHVLAAKYLATAMGPGVSADGFLFAVPGGFLTERGFSSEILERAMPVVLERASARLADRLTHGPVNL